jgi:hypothetical protein
MPRPGAPLRGRSPSPFPGPTLTPPRPTIAM